MSWDKFHLINYVLYMHYKNVNKNYYKRLICQICVSAIKKTLYAFKEDYISM